jgi:formylglycine-generating enzyme required for sulfatase activity
VSRHGLLSGLAIALMVAIGAASCAQVLGGAPDVPPLADAAGYDGTAAGEAGHETGAGSDAIPGSDGGADSSVDSTTAEGGSSDASKDASKDVDAGGTVDATPGGDGNVTDATPLDAGTEAATPSCAVSAVGTGNDCGGVTGTTSCCESLLVAGGSPFQTTVFDAGYTTTVSSFRLDAFEVTAGRFRAFVSALASASGIPGWTASAGALSPPAGAGKHAHLHNGNGLLNSGSGGGYESGWQSGWPAMPTSSATWTTQLSSCTAAFDTWNAGDDTLPISCVTWYDAYAFCIWDDGFLPSVSEFNYAYMGGTNEWKYPWGDSPPNPSLAVYQPGFSGAGAYGGIAPVGSLPAGQGLWGQLDLAGNLWEWELDWADQPSTTQSCSDCADTNSTEGSRILRGGDFADGTASLLSTDSTSDGPTNTFGNYGFRCARVP